MRAMNRASAIAVRSALGIAAGLAFLAPSHAVAGDKPNECGTRPPIETKAVPQLTKGDAMTIAVKAAKAEGYKLSEFEVPWFCFKAREGEWLLTFNGKPASGKKQPGFGVSIRDDTKATRIVPGS
jgi:hypothetical protein